MTAEILSSVREGRFVRQERLEDGGRIQSWVLAGAKGAVEVRGTGPGSLYCLVHRPWHERAVGHSLLILVDAEAFPDPRCGVIEGECCPLWLGEVIPLGLELSYPWAALETVYRVHLGEG